MINAQTYSKALVFAAKAHQWQLDKVGLPYILHPIRVSEAVNSWLEKTVAVLHDVVEDTDITIEEIYSTFGGTIGIAVDAITKREKVGGRYESYREYLDRVRSVPSARRVKLADMEDNSRPERIRYLSVAKQLRLLGKYTRGRQYLMTGIWHEDPNLDQVIKNGVNK
jgi:(p)ppGpp synthase/HD superfamily hydrolase